MKHHRTLPRQCQGEMLLVFLLHQIENEKNEKRDKMKIKGNSLLTIKRTCSAVILSNINAQTDLGDCKAALN